jgi:hypothetical protein
VRTKLSDRIRPNTEAAPWVVEEVKRLEEELEVAKALNRLTVKERDYERQCVKHLQDELNRTGERTY